MTVRTPIVLVGREHVPLAEDDTLSVPVPLSGSEDNLLSNTANGLMAELHVDPTGSIQLTGKGTSAKPLTGALKVDPVAGNLLTDSTAGIKVALTYGESETIAMRGDGTADQPLRADALVSGAADNLLSSTATGLYAAKEELSPDTGNTLVRKENGLYAGGGGAAGLTAVTTDPSLTGSGTEASPLAVVKSPESQNQLVIITSIDGSNGLFVRPASAQVRVNDKSLAKTTITTGNSFNMGLAVNLSATAGNALTLENDGLFVSSAITLSAQKSNILVKAADGYFVDGTHRIIPKFYATTVYPLIAADQTTTYPDGSIRSEVTWSGVNPPAADGVSAYTLERVQSLVRLMDASGNPVKLQLELVRVSGANWKLVALMSARPVSAYYISNNNEYSGNDGTLNNFPVSVTMLYGYNPAQLNLT